MFDVIRRIHLLSGTLVLGVLLAFFVVVLSGGVKARAQEATGDPVLAAAGDIAQCATQNDEATAALLGTMPEATVAALGDNAYPHGSDQDYLNCYDPSWGLYQAQTLPTTGNHEYDTAGASGYFNYFGATLNSFGEAATDPTKGYYSYDLGTWHVVVLNSNCSKVGGCGATSPEVQWLNADLAAHPSACTLAYWHEPRFSSIQTGLRLPAFWNALYKAKAEVVLNGHQHNYERFAPQTPAGKADPASGIREFVVGTGGGTLNAFNTAIMANSEVREASTYGVLKLTLHPNSYDWEFVPEAGQSFTDSGTTSCHGADTSPPLAQPPSQSIPANSTLETSATSTIPVKLNWSATDDSSGVSGYVLQQSTDGGATFQDVALPAPKATTTTVQLQPGGTYQFRVQATDGAGNKSEWASSPSFVVDPVQEDSSAVSYAGSWTTLASDVAYGGATSQSTTKNSTAGFAFSGSNVAWVATKGPDGGKARVLLDGTAIATVDLYATTSQPRKLVFSKGGLDPSIAHTLTVQVLGTKNASSSGTRVDADGFVALR